MIEFTPNEKIAIWKTAKQELDKHGGQHATAKIPLEKYPDFILDITLERKSPFEYTNDYFTVIVKFNDQHVCGYASSHSPEINYRTTLEESLDEFASIYNKLERGEAVQWCYTGRGSIDGVIAQAEAKRALTAYIKDKTMPEKPKTKTRAQMEEELFSRR